MNIWFHHLLVLFVLIGFIYVIIILALIFIVLLRHQWVVFSRLAQAWLVSTSVLGYRWRVLKTLLVIFISIEILNLLFFLLPLLPFWFFDIGLFLTHLDWVQDRRLLSLLPFASWLAFWEVRLFTFWVIRFFALWQVRFFALWQLRFLNLYWLSLF